VKLPRRQFLHLAVGAAVVPAKTNQWGSEEIQFEIA
jgi:hypothetical protein